MTTWRSLLRWSAFAVAFLLAVAGIALRDVEAGLFAIGLLVALALTRWRTGLLGTVGVGLLAANVALWMGPGAYSNITHGEGGWETLLPSLLTVVSASTLAAAIGDLVQRRRPGPSRGPRIVLALGLMLAVASVIVMRVATGDRTEPQPGDLVVVTEDVRFSDESLQAAAGEIGVFVSNKDLFWHTFTITELDVNVNVPVGAERRETFTAPPGEYEFVCAIPGHPQAGMRGTLRIR